MATMNFKVTGMMCGGCAAGVEKCVAALPGVTSAKVTLEAGALAVEADSQVTAQMIIDAVSDAGFDAQEC